MKANALLMCRNKGGGELRVDAADFVPGQWDKPKQAAVPAEVDAAETQHSTSGLTDDDSMQPGSDTNGVDWTAAEYSQQYYIAQVCCAIAPSFALSGAPLCFYPAIVPLELLPKLPCTHVPHVLAHSAHPLTSSGITGMDMERAVPAVRHLWIR